MGDLKKRWQNALLWLTVVAIALGIFCRFVNIDRKIYWHDETFTSLRISGFTEREMVEELRQQQLFDIGSVRKYQSINSERGMLDTIRGLAAEEPQNTPLYYTGARLWVQVFGSSVAAVRAFSALLSLLALPAVYWLCLELFQSRLTGAIAVMLLALSPFHVLYAQESRAYSLWTVMILLSSAALLRALRLRTRAAWLLYAVSLSMSLYSHLVSLLVTGVHGIYVLLQERSTKVPAPHQKSFLSYLVATSGAGLALVPWMVLAIANRSQISKNLNIGAEKWAVSPTSLLSGLLRQPGKLFYDVNAQTTDPLICQLIQRFFTIAFFTLLVYALYLLIRTTKRQSWLFVLGLILSTSVGLVVQDLILKGQGGGASLTARYQIPFYLGVQIAIAYLLSYQLTQQSFAQGKEAAKGYSQEWHRRIWQGIFASVLGISLFSSMSTVAARNWWTKGPTGLEAAFSAADVINQLPNPVLVTDGPSWDLTQISYLLSPQIKVLSAPHCYVCSIPPDLYFNPDFESLLREYSDVFVFPAATDNLLKRVQTQYKLESIALSPKPSLDLALYQVLPINVRASSSNASP
jgi:uncharacterized membrane protein